MNALIGFVAIVLMCVAWVFVTYGVGWLAGKIMNKWFSDYIVDIFDNGKFFVFMNGLLVEGMLLVLLALWVVGCCGLCSVSLIVGNFVMHLIK